MKRGNVGAWNLQQDSAGGQKRGYKERAFVIASGKGVKMRKERNRYVVSTYPKSDRRVKERERTPTRPPRWGERRRDKREKG